MTYTSTGERWKLNENYSVPNTLLRYDTVNPIYFKVLINYIRYKPYKPLMIVNNKNFILWSVLKIDLFKHTNSKMISFVFNTRFG